MTMRSYDDVEFRPWYLPDTARWLKLSLGARGLVAELVRKLDRHGRIALGEDPASDLAVILRLDEGDTRKALTELLGAGRLVWDPVDRTLSDPDMPARMRMGSAARMAKKRSLADAEKVAKAQAANDAASAPAPVSASHPSQPVTRVTSPNKGNILSPSDLPLICSGSDLSDPDQEIPPVPTRARWEGSSTMADSATGVFASAVGEAVGRPFVFPTARFHVSDLLALLSSAHAPLEGPAAIAWLRTAVVDWVKSQDGQGTWHPSKLTDWLNAGRPPRTQAAKRGGPRQPHAGPDPKCIADAKAGRTGTGDF